MLSSRFCLRVARSIHSGTQNHAMTPAVRELTDNLISGKRDALAKAITLIESTRKDHKEQAALMLNYIAQKKAESTTHASFNKGQTLRLGIAGPPGAGKSTFIEALGMRFVNNGHKVAVIPVDPSSHISGGSILGDKTRMEQLSRSLNAYVRASPTKGVLGGIAEHTSDVITLCEAGHYDVVIVESVGLGQSEVDIDMAVDMLLVIVPPGGGDSLQATKKGIMEAADMIVVNKADGSLLTAAKHTKADYSGAMQFIRQKHHCWITPVLMMSARTGDGVDAVESTIREFHSTLIDANLLQKKRSDQSVHWMWGQLKMQVISELERSSVVQETAAKLKGPVGVGHITPRAAAQQISELFLKGMKQ